MKRIPTLDGWRGVAILMVLCDHAQLAFLHNPIVRWSGFGTHGVTIFFVLSGFLITTRLLHEERIEPLQFYAARFRRLAPAAIAYLLVVLFISVASGYSRQLSRGIIPSLFFFRNYTTTGLLTGHFWSLSIEEQFYAVWPVVLILFRRKGAVLFCIFLVPICTLVRYAHWNHYFSTPSGFHTEVRIDALLIGCCTALLSSERIARIFTRRRSIVVGFGAAIAVCFYVYKFSYLIPTGESLCIAALIRSTTLHPDVKLWGFLQWEPLVFIGKMSYSFYIWNQVFFILWNPYLALIAIPIVSLVSYSYFESMGRKTAFEDSGFL